MQSRPRRGIIVVATPHTKSKAPQERHRPAHAAPTPDISHPRGCRKCSADFQVFTHGPALPSVGIDPAVMTRLVELAS